MMPGAVSRAVVVGKSRTRSKRQRGRIRGGIGKQDGLVAAAQDALVRGVGQIVRDRGDVAKIGAGIAGIYPGGAGCRIPRCPRARCPERRAGRCERRRPEYHGPSCRASSAPWWKLLTRFCASRQFCSMVASMELIMPTMRTSTAVATMSSTSVKPVRPGRCGVAQAKAAGSVSGTVCRS